MIRFPGRTFCRLQQCERSPSLAMRKFGISPRKFPTAAAAVLVIVLLFIVLDTDDLRVLLLPPAKFSDWYADKIEQHQARGSNGPIHPHPFRPVLQPPPCTEGDQMAVYVHSAVPNFQQRALIRATWGHLDVQEIFSAKLMFVLGQSLDQAVMAAVQRESECHDDVLQVDFLDSYSNLTHKAVSALTWLAASCPHVRFVLKTDDDVVVAMEELVTVLRNRFGSDWTPKRILLCSKISNPLVNRRWWSKWYMPKAVYLPHTYGDFCEGAAFLMSGDVMVALAGAAKDMPFFPLDDVFVTGMLAERLELHHLNMEKLYHTGNWGRIRASRRDLCFVVEQDPILFLNAWLATELYAFTKRGNAIRPKRKRKNRIPEYTEVGRLG